ncbi:MAG TPA: DUF1772 domain-containing protein [Burkholderiales bacterium]|nr:DUF1772 domain-containing protein [Burkholderiales bacterium]
MTIFELALLAAALLCALVAGFLFAFAVVVMPGIAKLDDAGFLRAFQVIDGVIQRGQPLFGLVWMGSVVAVVVAAFWGFWALAGLDRAIVMLAAAVYLLGVQIPTFAVNIPLNDRVQRLDITREEFEPRWNRWNAFRTACAALASVLFLVLLVRAPG